MGVNFEEKLRNQQYDDLWQEYCGFLDLDIGGYMQIQRRLMEEQIGLWSASALGKKLLDGGRPRTVEEFRRAVPLTTFEDYADVLLQKRSEMLPAEPVVWIQTTWEGGKHPIKLAPYTRGMLDVFKRNMVAALMLATSKRPGQFSIAPCDRTLYGLAPLPYVTGLFPLMLDEELPLRFLPPVDEAVRMSFGERNKKGFALGLQNGLDLFFGLSSVISYITTSFTAGGGKSKKNLFQYSPRHGLPLPRGLLPREAGRPHRAAEGHLPPQGAHLRGHRHKLLQALARGGVGGAPDGDLRGHRADADGDRDVGAQRPRLFPRQLLL